MPFPRVLLRCAGVAFVFGAGWAASATLHPAAAASVAREGLATDARSGPATCADPLAMEANANLVGEVRSVRRDLVLANERMQASAPPVDALPARLQASSEDWARRATDENPSIRIPCARWDGAPSLSLRGPGRIAHGRGVGDARRRADFLEMPDEERATLAEVYVRANARVWQSVRSPCEAEAEFRESVAQETDADDARRIALCREAILASSAQDPALGRAFHEVAALRASKRTDERLDTKGRVLLALGRAPEVLFDEMTRTFGREKATGLVDHGVTCFDETIYDLKPLTPRG